MGLFGIGKIKPTDMATKIIETSQKFECTSSDIHGMLQKCEILMYTYFHFDVKTYNDLPSNLRRAFHDDICNFLFQLYDRFLNITQTKVAQIMDSRINSYISFMKKKDYNGMQEFIIQLLMDCTEQDLPSSRHYDAVIDSYGALNLDAIGHYLIKGNFSDWFNNYMSPLFDTFRKFLKDNGFA